MKKIIYFLVFIIMSPVFAADKLHVSAMNDFSSINPTQNFQVMLVEDGVLNGIYMLRGDILNCTLNKTTNPTRAKRDAKIYFNVISYSDKKGTHQIEPKMIAKYAEKVLSVEEVKKTPPKKIAKKAVGTVGNLFVTGFSYGVSFVDGIKENKEDNRLKSGVKQVYDDSFLSYAEYGHEVQIKEGQEFYFIVKRAKEQD